MVVREKVELLNGSVMLAEGWAKYQRAHDLIELADWPQALALLAQAETIFRTHNAADGLWRALIGQALIHWRDGMAEVAEARALAALEAAEQNDDGFAVGNVTWRLANLKIEQAQYAEAADYLDQTQLALDASGVAPAGGVLAAAAQLCSEIVRWQQLHDRRQIGAREAEAAIIEIHGDLAARLRQAAAGMSAIALQPERPEGSELTLPVLPPVEPPSLPWIGLSAWLSRLWRKLIHGADGAVPPGVMRAPQNPPPGRGPPQTDALALPERRLAHGLPEPIAGDSGDRRVGAEPGTPAEPPPELARPASGGMAQPTTAVVEQPTKGDQLDTTGRALAKTMAPPPVDRASLPVGALSDGSAANPPAARQADAPRLEVQLFGQFRVALNGREIESWPSGRGRAIFKYLLTHRERPLARDVLMEAFWPEATAESARNSLNVAIYGLRQALRAADPVQVVMFQNGAYRLNPTLEISLDVDEFRRNVQSGRRGEEAGDTDAAIARYEAAAQLYQSDFMADDLADDWPVLPRERLRVDYLDTLDRLSQLYFTGEQYDQCATLCQMILAQDNCREDAHCRLIRCYSRQNQHLLALRQYQTCVEALDRELGVAPAAATTQLYERIRRREAV
jgi:DNA-binding SARP family transcriptional activator